MDKKKILVIIISIFALIISTVLIIKTINKQEQTNYRIPEGATLIENTNLLKSKNLNNILIDNVLMYTENEKSRYVATVRNTTQNDLTATLYIKFHEKENITEVVALYNQLIKPNNEKMIDISFEIDLTKITKIEYELK